MKSKQLLPLIRTTLAVSVIAATTQLALAAGNVKITPLGSHDGEFCKFDRAMILEDPDGTRILYDAGRTVAGPSPGSVTLEPLSRSNDGRAQAMVAA